MQNSILFQEIKIYNSLSGKKEIFRPIKKGFVGIYTCGPTVYNHVHLGNCRTFISFDIIVRYFRHLGYKVRYVRNITDVGHLEDESGEDKDKIVKRSRIERIEPMELAQKYTRDFHHILSLFGNIPPDIEPIATGHISEQIKIIEKLIDNEIAYEEEGSVYFDIEAYSEFVKNKPEYKSYGVLSRRKVEELLKNTRHLKNQIGKKHPQDFALWKKASEKHIMRWSSPWGEGFPGWHIECSAMSTKYLGEVFDIHGGGMDLKFPHHECEIAQAQGAYQKNPVNYWMHTNMLTLYGQKMSKSTGNTLLPMEIFKGEHASFKDSFSPEVVRFFMLQTHYRSVLDVSNCALSASEKGYYRLMDTFVKVSHLKLDSDKTFLKNQNKVSVFDFQEWKQRCYDAMNDDFNTPRLIAHLFEICPLIEEISKGKAYLNSSDLNFLKETMKSFISDVLAMDSICSVSLADDGSTKRVIKVINSAKKKVKKSLRNELNLSYNVSYCSLKKMRLHPSYYHLNESGSSELFLDAAPELLNLLIKIRKSARKEGNWTLSDEIRNELLKLGYRLRDHKDGTTDLET